METTVKIYADFNNADQEGRIRLNTKGTYQDLERKKVELREGLELLLDDDEGITTLGIVSFSQNENIWVAKINWDEIK